MRVLVLFLCLSVGRLAQRPQPCRSPPLLTGRLSVSTPKTEVMTFANYSYDAIGKRIRLTEFGYYKDTTFHLDVLLLYKQGVMYKIDEKSGTCSKRPLSVNFPSLAIPQDASLLEQVVLGSSSGPAQGVLVNTWGGELQMKKEKAKYMSTVTEFGCIPISTLFHTSRHGWVVTRFFNNVIGLMDPERLIIPAFCADAGLDEDRQDPVSFSLF